MNPQPLLTPEQHEILSLQQEVTTLRNDITRLAEGLTLALSLLNKANRHESK